MSKIRLNESPIAFQIIGQGPTLVLLHGFGGSHTHWEKLLPELSQHFTVVLPNLGSLTLGSITLTFSEQVDLLGDFKRALYDKFGKFSIAGISYGGALAWALAANDDEEIIDRLVLINPLPPNPLRWMVNRSLRRLLFLGRWTPVLAFYLLTPLAHWDFHNVASDIRVDWPTRMLSLRKIFSRRQKMLFHLIHRFAWILNNEKWSAWDIEIKKIKIPSVIIHGNKDRIFDESAVNYIQRNLEGAEVNIIEKGTHLAIHSNPIEICKILNGFLMNNPVQKTSGVRR